MAGADQDAPAVAPTGTAPPRRLGTVAAVGVGWVVLDQLSKWWVVTHLSDGHSIEIVGSLKLLLAHNAGAAFSVGEKSNLGPVIAVLAVVVVGVLVFTGSTTRSLGGACGVGLVAGGAIGNIIDRIFRQGSGFLGGRVVDFIYLSWWPTFNVADAGICIGAAVLVFFGFRTPHAAPMPDG